MLSEFLVVWQADFPCIVQRLGRELLVFCFVYRDTIDGEVGDDCLHLSWWHADGADGWMKIIPSETPNTSLPSFSLVAQFSVKLLLKMVRPIWNERISLVLALRREIPSSVPIQILP